MAFPISASLLDALVLAVVSKEDTYGYKITQEVKDAVEISESTLYPVLRRLQKDACLTTYDMEYLGRNRRYYKITSKGLTLLSSYRSEWEIYKTSMSKVLSGGKMND
jgi:PadR family transcriptional regulator PadR